MTDESGPRPWSPWVYALLGCLGAVAFGCLGVAVLLGTCVKAGADLMDPRKQAENARRLLGGVPTGYHALTGVSLLGQDVVLLVNAEPLADGGMVGRGDRVLTYVNSRPPNAAEVRAYVAGSSDDAQVLEAAKLQVRIEQVVKRSSLVLRGRKYTVMTARGQSGYLRATQQGEVPLLSLVLFDCPDKGLPALVWTQADPAPDRPAADLDLTGTVGDDQELSALLAEVNPCQSP